MRGWVPRSQRAGASASKLFPHLGIDQEVKLELLGRASMDRGVLSRGVDRSDDEVEEPQRRLCKT
jgi:hypothetical protein